ncbi:MAG: hypothetical protein VKJ24_21380 [Synechococcales bacterium]|nr:hypothetical protein [Synechococcales bacterium]
MTQIPHDQLAKQYLEEFLTPLGTVQRQYEVPGEAKYVDIWFVPDSTVQQSLSDLGLLGRMVDGMCLIEPYRNAPSRTEVRTSLMKLLWIQEDEQRKATQLKQPLSESELPRLWILAATVSQPLVKDLGGQVNAGWYPGVYFLHEIFKTAIVAIDQLPMIPETLLLRVLGRGETQRQAIEEVLSLPETAPQRNVILQLVASWKVRMDMGELQDFIQREEIMAISRAFELWEQEVKNQGWQEGRQEGRQGREVEIALNLLREQIPLETIARTTGLTIAQLQDLQSQLQ